MSQMRKTIMKTIRVKDFCTHPGPALAAEGNSSGEEFRELVVRPEFDVLYEAVRNDENSEDRLTVDFDDVYGYSHQWLEEVFGGMICFNSYPEAKAFVKFVELKCDNEPYISDIVLDIVTESMEGVEAIEKKNANVSPKNSDDVGKSEETGPRQHIYVSTENGLQQVRACKNEYRYPCWCCEWSPEFKGLRINTKLCEHGFEHGSGCGVCDINCQNLCPHGYTNAGKFCTDCIIKGNQAKKLGSFPRCTHGIITELCVTCTPTLDESGQIPADLCMHGHKKDDCSGCSLCEHGFFKRNCGVCRTCKHGVNQSGLGCDKCDTDDLDDIYFNGECWIPKTFSMVNKEETDISDDTEQDDMMEYMQWLYV